MASERQRHWPGAGHQILQVHTLPKFLSTRALLAVIPTRRPAGENTPLSSPTVRSFIHPSSGVSIAVIIRFPLKTICLDRQRYAELVKYRLVCYLLLITRALLDIVRTRGSIGKGLHFPFSVKV